MRQITEREQDPMTCGGTGRCDQELRICGGLHRGGYMVADPEERLDRGTVQDGER